MWYMVTIQALSISSMVYISFVRYLSHYSQFYQLKKKITITITITFHKRSPTHRLKTSHGENNKTFIQNLSINFFWPIKPPKKGAILQTE